MIGGRRPFRGGERVRQQMRAGSPVAVRRLVGLETLESRQLLAAIFSVGELPRLAVDPSEHRDAAFIVQFKPGASAPGSLAAHLAGGSLGAEWAAIPGLREVQLQAGANVESARQAYAADPNVLFAEPDYRVSLNWTPNDPLYGEQWNLTNTGEQGGLPGSDIRAAAAWDVTRGHPSVVVAVIDTGVDYTHPDLAPNMWVNTGEVADNGLDDDGNGFVDDIYGYDFANQDGDPMDDYFHGTHVAGIIAAVADNGLGMAGVAPSTRIMALKFLDAEGHGYTSDAIAALNYAVAHGASISNSSWGGGEFSQAFQSALEQAAEQSHIFVASAGNNGSNNDLRPFYPASYSVSNIVSVAATDRSDQRASFSNYGKNAVDLAAPGVDIYSTTPMRFTAGMFAAGLVPGYGQQSGTSMAAPHVAGALALLRSVHPEWPAEQLISKVLATTDPVPALANATASGGRLNVARALDVIAVDTTPPRVVKATPAGIIAAPFDHLRITFSEPIDPSTFDAGDIVSFYDPAGASIPVIDVTPVPGSAKSFDITFEMVSALGDYTLTLGPHILDLAGNEVDQNGDGIAGVDGSDHFTAIVSLVNSSVFSSANVPLNFADLEMHASYLSIDQDLPVGDVDVSLHLTFPRSDSLKIWLVSPDGTTVVLSDRHGGEEANYWDTVFDDSAAVPIATGAAPFTGVFQPDELLAALNGENARGTWALFVQNVSDLPSEGTLNAWSLDIEPGEYSGGGSGGEGQINHPPLAANDAITIIQNNPYTFSAATLLANDSDPDGDVLAVIDVYNAVGGAVARDGNGNITFTPATGGLAPGSFQYVVSDGLTTATATVAVSVAPQFPWHNADRPEDVNGDNYVVPADALYVINQINARGSGGIIGVSSLAADLFYDVVADNAINPSDALAVINWINAHPKQTSPLSATVANTAAAQDAAEGEAFSAATSLFAALAADTSGTSLSPPTSTPSWLLLLPAAEQMPLDSARTFAEASSSADDGPLHAAAVDQCLAADDDGFLSDNLSLLSRGRRKK